MISCIHALALAVPVRLHSVDLVLIAVYLLGITLFGLRFRTTKTTGGRSLKSYFLADKSIPWWAIALSIVSAETSTLTIISIPGLAYGGDFGFLQVVFGYLVGRVVVALIFLPKYFQGEMLTAYQLIDKRFGPALHKVTALLFLLTRAAAEGVRVFAVSIVVGIAIGTRDVLSIAIISALTLLYTFEGGMAAVIWTDVVQMVIYIAGTIVAIATLGTHVPGGWAQIHDVAAAAGKFHLFHFALNLTETYTFWAGLIGGTFLTMASHGTDQLMVQRMLAARNLRQSVVALLSSGVVILLQFTLFLFIGAGLFVFYGLHPTAFASADRIFPTFIVREMPVGVAGLLIAAILAAAMSNLSAALNSLSSTTVVDFYMHWRPAADDRERMLISRSSTVVWAFVLFAIAVYSVHAGGKGHVVEIGLSIASVAYGALLGVFLLGSLTRYASQTGAILGMIAGFSINMLLWLHAGPIDLGVITIPHVAWTWYVFIGAVATFGIGTLASSIFRTKPKAKVLATTTLLAIFALNATSARAQARVPHLRGSSIAAKVGSTEALNFTAVSTLVDNAIAQKKLPGAVVLIGHDNNVVFEHAYGNRSLDPTVEPMTEDTVFDMASLTKCLVTATAVMQLYEEHKLDFDDPVAKYLPDFAANEKSGVTIRELLTHYSGLPPDIDLKDAWGLAAPDKAEGIRRALAARLVSTPGTHFEYSDINFITLGALVEKLSGESLDVYAQQHIFTPLGMGHTRYLPMDKSCGRLADPLAPRGQAASMGIRRCGPNEWNRFELVTHIAPTTYDDEGSAVTNPDYGKMLRGVVNDPTTRRMGGVAGHAGVFSTAADTRRFTQALLDKLLRNTGPFPLKQSTLKLMTRPEQPATAEANATIFTADGQLTRGVATRGFGWDINSPFSRPRGSVFPIGSFGHTGFTGTSIWMDPGSDSYVIILSNAVHPRGAAPISVLRGQIATAAAKALGVSASEIAIPDNAVSGEVSTRTLTGIDVLEASHYAALADAARRHGNRLRLGLLTNQSGLDAKGRRTVDVLAKDAPQFVPGLTLTTLFSPEHGIFGKQDTTRMAAETDTDTRLPVISLYGPKDSDKRPRLEDLAKLDAVVIDLQDTGVRFYTYETGVGYFLEAAAKAHIDVIVLDRPNPIGGDQVQGPVSDPGLESYTDYMPLPVRYGLTLGELARYINGERRLPSPTSPDVQVPIDAHLTVVPMQNWSRGEYFDQTGVAWVNPSPNLRSLTAATLYPGVALLDLTNISVGRGTSTPFEHIGAPFIDAPALAKYLNSRNIPGVTFSPTRFQIDEDSNHYPYHGQTIPGLHITLTDRRALDAPEMGIEIISALHRFYPRQFNLAKAGQLIANVNTMLAIENGEDPRTIAGSWTSDISAFKKRRTPYLLYR